MGDYPIKRKEALLPLSGYPPAPVLQPSVVLGGLERVCPRAVISAISPWQLEVLEQHCRL